MKRLILFVFFSSRVLLGYSEGKTTIDTIYKVIDQKNLTAIDVVDTLPILFFVANLNKTEENIQKVKARYLKRFNPSISVENRYGATYLDIESYILSREVGKAIYKAHEFHQRAKSSKKLLLLKRSYDLYLHIYNSFDMPKEKLEYAKKAYIADSMIALTKIDRLSSLRVYSWTLFQTGIVLKDTILLNNAAALMKQILIEIRSHNLAWDVVFECYKTYMMVLSRLKRYDEILNICHEAISVNSKVKCPTEQCRIYHRLTMSLLYAQLGTAHASLKHRDSAFYYLKLPIHFLDKKVPRATYYPSNGKFIDYPQWRNLVDAHMRFNEYEEAARLLDLALYSKYKIEDQDYIPVLYKHGYEIYPRVGMYKKAVECYRESNLMDIRQQEELKKIYDLARNTSTAIQLKDAQETSRLEKTQIELKTKKEREQKRLILIFSAIGFLGLLIFIGFQYNRFLVIRKQKTIIEDEKKRSEELLLNILPEEVAEELKNKGSADAKLFDEVTVMFTDFKDFTRISETLSPEELVAEIHYCFKAFDDIITRHNIEKIKTIGDAYMCVGGLPIFNTTHAIDVISAAIEIQEFIAQHIKERESQGKKAFEIRIGIHTGNVVAGIVGVKKFAYDIWGDTVNIASRMESSGEAGKINISGSTFELIKDKFICTYRGKIEAKGKGELDMYFVEVNPS